MRISYRKLFHFPFPWLASLSHLVLRVSLISSRLQPYGLFVRTANVIQRSQAICPFTLSTEVVGMISISLPVPVSSPRSRRKREREKNAHSSTSPSADGDHKVSSAEMHVKRFKRAPEVSFAPCRLRSRRRRRFPLTLRSPFHCSFRYHPHRRVNLFHVAVSSRRSHELRERELLHRHRMHSTTARFETSHERDSSLFAYPPANGFLPLYARARARNDGKR